MRFQHVHCTPPEDFFLCHIVQVLTPDFWQKSSLKSSLPTDPFIFNHLNHSLPHLVWCHVELTFLF